MASEPPGHLHSSGICTLPKVMIAGCKAFLVEESQWTPGESSKHTAKPPREYFYQKVSLCKISFFFFLNSPLSKKSTTKNQPQAEV